MPEKHDLSAAQAAKTLGISLTTLYAYVSRGLIRSEAAGAKTRVRRYAREDIDRLRARQEQRHNPDRAAEQALRWGMPVLESSLSLITDGRLYYRGHDAVDLAQHSTFEKVAAILWLDASPLETTTFIEPSMAGREPFADLADWLKLLPNAPAVELFQAVLPLAASRDPAAYDLRPGAVAQTGARILELLTAAAAHPAVPAAGRIAERLTRAWLPNTSARRADQATRLIEAALILCADHELNTSAFTARCVASVRATPYHVVMAALAALQGVRHGGHSVRVEALFDTVGTPGRAREGIGAWLKRGDSLPGFGHPLYSHGDPRGRALIDLIEQVRPHSRDLALGKAIAEEALGVIGEYPTIDFALVVAARALGLTRGSALALFALGRTAGWIAHAMEQYQVQAMIRPRARYVGRMKVEVSRPFQFA